MSPEISTNTIFVNFSNQNRLSSSDNCCTLVLEIFVHLHSLARDHGALTRDETRVEVSILLLFKELTLCSNRIFHENSSEFSGLILWGRII